MQRGALAKEDLPYLGAGIRHAFGYDAPDIIPNVDDAIKELDKNNPSPPVTQAVYAAPQAPRPYDDIAARIGNPDGTPYIPPPATPAKSLSAFERVTKGLRSIVAIVLGLCVVLLVIGPVVAGVKKAKPVLKWAVKKSVVVGAYLLGAFKWSLRLAIAPAKSQKNAGD